MCPNEHRSGSQQMGGIGVFFYCDLLACTDKVTRPFVLQSVCHTYKTISYWQVTSILVALSVSIPCLSSTN